MGKNIFFIFLSTLLPGLPLECQNDQARVCTFFGVAFRYWKAPNKPAAIVKNAVIRIIRCLACFCPSSGKFAQSNYSLSHLSEIVLHVHPA